ncbi:MAG: ferredoxin family protein [Syntrophales bacterium]|nr:ferredoxin family protein [Syntrophales bacterium]
MEFWRVPLDVDKVQVTRGKVHILEDRCKGCGYCIEFCPRQVLKVSSRFNKKGYHPPVVKKADACVNCHYCEIICPEFAIYSVKALNQQDVQEEEESL